MSRTSNALRNVKYSFVGQILWLIISFISRTVFVRVLSAEYLGLHGLFSNILSLLSLAELGFGSAIVFSMYKPLADQDIYKINSLMQLYKKIYTIIGIVIFIIGLILMPFLNVFIKKTPDIDFVKVIFFLYLLNTVISYFYSYKRSILIADQRKYLESFYKYSLSIGLNIAQIVMLLFTRSFIFYLLLQIIFTILENIIISRKVNRLYPFINQKNNIKPLNDKEKKQINKNVRAMISHKIGGVVVNGTDNIIISKFIGVIEVGIYSNYQLIINALNTIYSLFFDSLTASIGNLGVTESNEHKNFIFNVISFLGFWIYGFSSISLLILINPFIKLWLGEIYNFNIQLVLIIVVNFYLTGMRKSVLTFRNALGLFWYDRHKPIFESLINLIASVILVNIYGVSGVFIGTIISTLTTCFWIEPYILYKYGFEKKPTQYFIKYMYYTIILIISGYTTWYISQMINIGSLFSFIIQAVICAIVPNVIFIFLFWRTKEFQYILSLTKRTVIEVVNKIKLK